MGSKTSRIRLLTSIAGMEFSYGFNQVVDHEAVEAGRLVASGQAEYADDAPLTFPAKPVKKSPTTSREDGSTTAQDPEKDAAKKATADAAKLAADQKVDADAEAAAKKASDQAEKDAKKAAEKAAKDAAKKASASEKK